MIKYNILICGIGGQGVISLGTALKLAAIREGVLVNGAEKRGGAQREGVVTSNVRYVKPDEDDSSNERVMAVSGIIPVAGADMMISMEPLEALRHARYLKEDSVLIINDFPLIPVAVRTGDFGYPEIDLIYSRLREFTPHLYINNIDDLSRQNFNSLKYINTISMGLAYAVGKIPVSKESLLVTIKEQFPDFKTNKRAFELGVELGN